MHTRMSILTGLVNGIVRFRGHPEEKILLTKTLNATMGTYLDQWAEDKNAYDAVFGQATDDKIDYPPPSDFPALTGDAEVDAKAIAQWIGAPDVARVKEDFDIDAAALFENDGVIGDGQAT